MRRKDLLLIFFAALIVTATMTNRIPITTAQQKGTTAVSPLVIDTRNLKKIGDTFSINITIANFEHLWGYQYAIYYNASVINATGVGVNNDEEPLDSRFTNIPQPIEIKGNHTAVSRGTFNGDTIGITSTDPIAVDQINFLVTGNGTTGIIFNAPWDPTYTALVDVWGVPILTYVVSGRFSNTQVLETHDVAVTSASLSKTTGAPGDTITIDAVVANNGDFSENITVTAKYNQTQIGTQQTVTNLAKDDDQTLSFTWDTAGLASGIYIVTVEATVPIDDDLSNNQLTAGEVTLTTGGGDEGISTQLIYIGAGIGIVIIVIVAVFALRARKSR